MAEDTTSLKSSSAAALMSMKSAQSYPVTPSKRPHSSRIRKPNSRLYFGEDDDVVVTKHTKPRGAALKARPTNQIGVLDQYQSRASFNLNPVSNNPFHSVLSTPDKRAAQGIGVRLRNLLKLPKAHKWVCYEWFYADIDRTLFEAENDFLICLRESFPLLKTRRLSRTEWCKVRRLLGKPRRCSAAFFAEERAALHKKREKIRVLQQSKEVEDIDLKDLPEEIPLPLSIGTKVTARLRYPQDGLFTGEIDAVDTVNNTYRIDFDKQGLGIHTVPDIEVMSNEVPESIPLSSYRVSNKKRPFAGTLYSPMRYQGGLNTSGLVGDNDPLLGSSPIKYDSWQMMEEGNYGGFPVKFLSLVTRLTKILQQKKKKVSELKEMNTEAEKLKSQSLDYQPHFQQKYAAVILELETLNKQLNEHLQGVHKFAQELNPEEDGAEPASELQRVCDDEAKLMVVQTNLSHGRKMVHSERSLDLIKKLTSLLLQIKMFAEHDMHSFEFKHIQDALTEIKKSIDPSNLGVFQNNVEIHVNHIQSGMSQMSNLHAFHTHNNPVLM